MLIVVFQRQGVLRTHDPVDIGNRLVRQEVRRASCKSVFRKIDGRNETLGRGDQKLPVWHFVVEQAEGNRTDVAGSRPDRRLHLPLSGEVAGKRRATRTSGPASKRTQ